MAINWINGTAGDDVLTGKTGSDGLVGVNLLDASMIHSF